MILVSTASDIGAAIRAERKRQNLTQTELADLCAVSLSFVSNLENGKPTTELAKALNVINTLGFDVVLAKRGE
ncbi:MULTISPECIES: helix-turn-helix domain-containing protein [unclassified Adlercreutzia]|uniref:helix-turn-helix domain-containing protein n=1 Tax=unclassified Adlercreutzia TaxID=2636013 RepID=UPI0019827154|nr:MULTISPECIES: helix-turn-helix domain-containing protein [unclassified Adlercreutzia]